MPSHESASAITRIVGRVDLVELALDRRSGARRRRRRSQTAASVAAS
jgi:hypothetical protein